MKIKFKNKMPNEVHRGIIEEIGGGYPPSIGFLLVSKRPSSSLMDHSKPRAYRGRRGPSVGTRGTTSSVYGSRGCASSMGAFPNAGLIWHSPQCRVLSHNRDGRIRIIVMNAISHKSMQRIASDEQSTSSKPVKYQMWSD